MSDQQIMRTAIQKVATGPEYSKDLTLDEAHAAMKVVLSGQADPVQAAVLLIALRMKRETLDEFTGALRALREVTLEVVADVAELLDVCDPYDGFTRGLLVSPFLPAVLAACGVPTVSHGLASTGPKFGATHHSVLREAGIDVSLSPEQAAARVADGAIGWAYVDQQQFCPSLSGLADLRRRIVKRPIITTIETLSGPIRAKGKTHMMSGYVHKAYPPIYAHLAREAGFDSAAIVRGVEGGMTPSLKQPAKLWSYHDFGAETDLDMNPVALGIQQESRGVPVPEQISAVKASDNIATTIDVQQASKAAAEAGFSALKGQAGAARDSLTYAAAIALFHLKKVDSLAAGADQARSVLDSGAALERFGV
ncbi:MAG TPA: anthranilate phosphoribosyltransferase [Gammaproteobacteria bacterium]|nr:anthranilate phosphoribosyltransferase [Gammaproteobacteria bacterium]